MPRVTELLDTYPLSLGRVDRGKLTTCIEKLMDCAQACTACADACLSESRAAELAKCVRSNLDCADICTATERVLSRHTGYDANITHAILAACAQTCRSCADECDRHGKLHEHCRICAEQCRLCEVACQDLIAAMG